MQPCSCDLVGWGGPYYSIGGGHRKRLVKSYDLQQSSAHHQGGGKVQREPTRSYGDLEKRVSNYRLTNIKNPVKEQLVYLHQPSCRKTIQRFVPSAALGLERRAVAARRCTIAALLTKRLRGENTRRSASRNTRSALAASKTQHALPVVSALCPIQSICELGEA